MNPLVAAVLLLAFVVLVGLCLRLAGEVKDPERARRARIVVLVVAIVILVLWLFGPLHLPRIRIG